jgi:enediyne biosynthesis protein E4
MHKLYDISLTCIFVLLFLLFSCTREQPRVVFTDVAQSSGIDFNYTFGDYYYENILESSGSGVTIFDFNNDGFMDVFLLNGTYLEGISDTGGLRFKDTPDRLYKNNGNGTFTDVTEKSGLGDTIWSMAAAPYDYNHDGYSDIFLLNYGPNVFFRNNRNGTFTNITDSLSELRGPDTLNGFVKWSIGASFWDYNNDGRMDVMVGNFLAFNPAYLSVKTPGMMPHPSEYRGQASMLYEQQPDGKFKEVTKENKLYYPDSKCMGLTVFDYDIDGDIDIYQANDHQLNFMFRNNQGKYTEVGTTIGVAGNTQGLPTGSMHGTIGDVDGDGLIDILVVDLSYGALYRNMGNGFYEDISEKSGISAPMAGKGEWGAALFDYDNDGDLDIITANGNGEELIMQYPLLLENDGKGHFTNTGQQHGAYFSTKRSGRGLAVIDYDNDGDLDVVISHVDLQATASLLRNDGGNKNNWLGLTLLGDQGMYSAATARVIVYAGDKKQVFVNQWANGYLSNMDPRIHIGLGKQETVEKIEIVWPNGKTESYSNITANSYITIKEGTGIVPR